MTNKTSDEIREDYHVQEVRRHGSRGFVRPYIDRHRQRRTGHTRSAAGLCRQMLDYAGKGRFVVGRLAKRERPEFTESLRRLNEEACRAG